LETTETKKERKSNQTTLLKKRVDELENIVNELKNKPAPVDLIAFEAKIEGFENVLNGINIDGVKSRLFDLEEKTSKSIGEFKQILSEFKKSFEEFKKVWGHNEEGLTVNDHFKGQNVEKPFIHGGVPVDENGAPLKKKPKSKLQESMIGDLPVLNVP
jgi:hypothetical protein